MGGDSGFSANCPRFRLEYRYLFGIAARVGHHLHSMSSSPRVSVALPVSGDPPRLERAFSSIQKQTLAQIEILLIPNGASDETRTIIDRLAASDDRVRVIARSQASLPAALNDALTQAQAPLVARMDADDTCSADRLERQVAFMDAHGEIAVLGCAWEAVNDDGRVLYTVHPPQDPRRLRWKLLTGNQLAHGSVMLRRDAVLNMGGYNEHCTKGQDYELWLRASRTLAVAALPDTLYQYHAHTTQGLATSQEQALTAASAMLDAWRNLPNLDASRDEGCQPSADAAMPDDLTDLLARALLDDDQTAAAIDRLDHHLDEQGPTREGLLAHLWLTSRKPPATREAVAACRLSRLREVGSKIRSDGTQSVWLFGAGSHSGWLVEHKGALGLKIDGIVDDALVGTTRHGHTVREPSSLAAGQTVLISSDAHEERIWRSCQPLRDAGVRVVRLYAG
jgi:Glycosyl transferase family 2